MMASLTISHPEVDGKLVCLGHETMEDGVGKVCRHVNNLSLEVK